MEGVWYDQETHQMPEHTEPQIDHLKTPSCHMLLPLAGLDSFTNVRNQPLNLERWHIHRVGRYRCHSRGNEWKSSANRLRCRERCYNLNVLVVGGDIKVLHNQAFFLFFYLNLEINVQQVNLLLRRTGRICPASLLNGQRGA